MALKEYDLLAQRVHYHFQQQQQQQLQNPPYSKQEVRTTLKEMSELPTKEEKAFLEETNKSLPSSDSDSEIETQSPVSISAVADPTEKSEEEKSKSKEILKSRMDNNVFDAIYRKNLLAYMDDCTNPENQFIPGYWVVYFDGKFQAMSDALQVALNVVPEEQRHLCYFTQQHS